MTDKIAHSILTKERNCVVSKMICNKQCTECQFYSNSLELSIALGHVLDILKARCPELYFSNQLVDLNTEVNDSNGN